RKTTLSLLKQQAFQRKKVHHSNRQAKRNERLYNKTQLIKTIEAYLRILRRQKCNAQADEKIQWFNHLKESAKDANEKDLEIFQLIYSDFNSLKRKSGKSDEEIEWYQRESDFHLQIRLLKNRIEDLKSMLGISTRSYKTVTNERLYLEAMDSTADMDPISGPINTSDIIEIIDDD
ncbi:488_t:CDS:2, partial [Racocetra fulgida]